MSHALITVVITGTSRLEPSGSTVGRKRMGGNQGLRLELNVGPAALLGPVGDWCSRNIGR